MAYNETDTGLDLNFDSDPEERKRRLAAIAGIIKGESLGNTAEQMIGERVAPIAEAVTNPRQALEQRFGVPKTGPVAPEAQPNQQPTQAGPINPNEPVPEIGQVPQPGPATQVAGPAPAPAALSKEAATQVAQTNPQITAGAIPGQGTNLNDVYHDSVIAARNEQDPQKRRQAYAALLANENVPEGYKSMAQRFISEEYTKQREQAKAEEKIAQATPNDLARYMQGKSEDGSYLKAILFQRLGLTELAKEEQQKLGAGTKMASAVDAVTQQRYTVERNANGEIIRAFNTEGKKAGQEEIARLSAATLPTQAHQLPSVHGSPVINAQGQTGLLMYDPQTQASYVQVGNQRLPTNGWTTMAQNVQNVYGASQAQALGKGAGEGFAPTPMKPLPGQVPQAPGAVAQPQVQTQPGVVPQAAPTTVPTQGGGATPQQRIQGDIAALEREIATTKDTPANQGRLQILRQELNTARQQAQQPAAQTGVPGAGIAQQKANLEIEQARLKEEQKPAAEARGKETAASIKKQAFADNAYPIVRELGSIIKDSTGSGIGANVDELAGLIGSSPKGAQAIAKLETFASPLVSMVPRFEGSQSDRDVQMYQKQAGDFANPKLPIATRLAALQGMVKLLQIYDKEGANDWGALSSQQEKTIDGVTYINDGKGWKKKK